jgi:diguanylate cyclase (GGDEF)-like protein
MRSGFVSLALALAVAGPAWSTAVPAEPTSPPAAPGSSNDPTEHTRPALRVFDTQDGLPQNTVHAIGLDGSGRLWVGTQDGAAFYDGRRWQEVRLPGRAPTAQVRTVLTARDGALWFGTAAGGLLRLHDGAWTRYTAALGALPVDRVNALIETDDRDGTALWVATHGGGVTRLLGERWQTFGVADGLPDGRVWALLVSRDATGARTLWAGTEGGLAALRPGADRFSVERGLPGTAVNALAETLDADGHPRLWAGTFGHGLWRFDGTTWSRLGRDEGLGSEFVTSLHTGRSGDARRVLWVGTDGGGLSRVEGDRVSRLGPAEGLPATAVYSLFETTAEEGGQALWIGTRGHGLVRLREGRWRTLLPEAGHRPVGVNAVAESRPAGGAPTLWIGTDGDGLLSFADGLWVRHRASPGGLPSDTIQCLLATRSPAGGEALWVGTRHAGLARREAGGWRRFDRRSGALPNDLVQSLAASVEDDGSTALWVGTRAGLTQFAGGRWTSPGAAPGKPEGAVFALATTRSAAGRRVLWVGTAHGLGRLEAGRWRRWDSRSGLQADQVQALHASPEPRPTLWIGTAGGGVALLDLEAESAPLRVLDSASEPPLPNDFVYSILEDRRGRIYLLHNRGVARLAQRPDVPHGEPAFDVFNFTAEDGLPIDQGSPGAGMVDSAGRVWVGTAAGAAVLDPAREAPDREPKRLLLRGEIRQHDRAPLVAGTRLPRERNHVGLDFALLSFFREGGTRYRSQLAGLEAQPTDWSAESRRDFSALRPGSYVFRVWGRDYAGNVSGPRELPFSVAPAWWETWWARLVALALAGVALTLAVRAGLQRHRRRERELSRVVDARTRQLREAHDLLVSLSYVDALTSVANRRRFDEMLETEWQRAIRQSHAVALVLVDIDSFKAFNDGYGHQRGDDCLRRVARGLDDALLRAGDLVGRYGGEEFGIVLPATDLAGAVLLAEQLRARIEALRIEHRASGVAPVVTISCGVAAMAPRSGDEPRELVHRADLALYRAKQNGRNRVEAYRETGELPPLRAEETQPGGDHPVLPFPQRRR